MQTLLGVLLASLSALSFALLSFTVKTSLAEVPVSIILLIQSVIGLLLVMPLIIKKYGVSALNIFTFSAINKLHFTRAIFSIGISYFMFVSLKYIPFMDSVLIYNLNPFFIPFTALLILGDKINHYLWPFILLGFTGVSLTLKIDEALFSLPILFALSSALCVTVTIVLIRKILAIDGGIKSLYCFFAYASFIAVILFILIDARYVNIINIIRSYCWTLVVAGILYFFTQFALVYSGKFIRPPVIACTYYTNIIFSLILSYLFLSGEVTIKMVAGCTLIITGGIGVIYMQSYMQKRKSKS